MIFMNLLKSLDDLLFEIMGWLVFYPFTFWRTLRHPWRMMDYCLATQSNWRWSVRVA